MKNNIELRSKRVEYEMLWDKTESAAFYIKATILREVRENMMWSPDYKTFGEYTKIRFDFDKTRASRYISALTVAENLELCEVVLPNALLNGNNIKHNDDIVTEWELRPLTKYNNDPDFQRQVWAALPDNKTARAVALWMAKAIVIVVSWNIMRCRLTRLNGL